MKLNNKGFAISSIIYSILVLFLILIFSLLGILGTRKLVFDKMKKDVMDNLNGDMVEKEPEVEGKSLVEELKKQYSESNTVGLLKDDTGYYYKGTNEEVSNNFVWFGGHLWRVISIDNDNNITMITQQPITAILFTNAIWTTQAQYEASYINHWLNNETDGIFYKSLAKEDRTKILNNTFNVGGEYNSTTNQVENISSITTTQKVGLLDEIQYTKSKGIDSFLNIKDIFILSNRYSTSFIREVYYTGNLSFANSANVFGVRPVIKISSFTIFTGKGTLDDPYRESSVTTNTSNIKIGEYISIPTTGTDCGTDKKCLFRVVSKDDNSIKVILNGLLPKTSAFGSTTIYTNGNTIDTVVTTFANTIDSSYRYSGTDKAFEIGTYNDVANYTAVQNKKYTGNVGLPVSGEMFTANDIDISTSTTKTFVNVATIENPIAANDFWAMNAFNASNVRFVNDQGRLDYYIPSSEFGVRPVLFLNNNLAFTGGEGTAENPFTLK